MCYIDVRVHRESFEVGLRVLLSGYTWAIREVELKYGGAPREVVLPANSMAEHEGDIEKVSPRAR